MGGMVVIVVIGFGPKLDPVLKPSHARIPRTSSRIFHVPTFPIFQGLKD